MRRVPHEFVTSEIRAADWEASGLRGGDGGLPQRPLLRAGIDQVGSPGPIDRAALRQAVPQEPKNDAADAEAIVEAPLRPTMRFVEPKTAEQQARAVASWTREQLLKQRTGVHQFFPPEVTIGPKDEPYGTYYKFYNGSRIDTLDRERSGPFNERGLCTAIGDANGRIALDAGRIGRHHIWSEKYVVLPGWVWASDAMVDRLATSGLKGGE